MYIQLNPTEKLDIRMFVYYKLYLYTLLQLGQTRISLL